MAHKADIVICGAGIAGIAAAYHLSHAPGRRRILLVDERAPMSLTSDKSTECYRNFWPGPDDAMVRLMSRSIDLLEDRAQETGNAFRMNRRGYVYATADPGRVSQFVAAARRAADQGTGPVRSDDYVPVMAGRDGFSGEPDGVDVIQETRTIRAHFPYLSERTIGVMHLRRCGWFSGYELGMSLLEMARTRGVELAAGRIEAVDVRGGRVRGARLAGGGAIETEIFINAAGPFVAPVGRMTGVDLPVVSERHLKSAFTDHLGVVPRDAPLLIWTDPQALPWSPEERAVIAESADTRHLLEPFPAGVHARPEGGRDSPIVLMLWAYDARPVPESWPLPIDPAFPDVVLRGLATMVPGLGAYFGRAPRPQVDGGYYTKTRENRPLVGPLPIPGAYLIGALSGFGLMAACAAGELLAAHVTGASLPPYAPAFMLARYEDPAYQTLLLDWGDTGQL